MRADRGQRYFFYGTLLDADVRRLVFGPTGEPEVESAVLPGHRLLLARGRNYPVAVRSTIADAAGVVTEPLGLEATERLAFYEGPDDYRATTRCVRLVRGGKVEAQVFMPQRRVAPSTIAWDLARWQRVVKPRFLKRVVEWMVQYRPSPAVLAERRRKGPEPGRRARTS